MFDLVLMDSSGHESIIHYDPRTSRCKWKDTGHSLDFDGFKFEATVSDWGLAFPVSPSNPSRKTRFPRTIKIQLGLKCNYTCTYCNQRSQPHDGDANLKAVERFLSKFPEWFELDDPIKIEFWGGEPLVYWKTLKPLAEGIRKIAPTASFSLITNGSLLDKEKVDWLFEVGFNIAISHDGPSHFVTRGPDPLKDPECRRWIRYAHDRLSSESRIGFNCVLSSKNITLFPVRRYIAEQLGVPISSINLSTEEILLPYDKGGLSLSVLDENLTKRLIHTVFFEAITGRTNGMASVEGKITEFLKSLSQGRPVQTLGQKCGMDRDDNIAIDLNGNVLTCQNTSAKGKHRIGHLDQFDKIKLDTAHHWSTRSECPKCPLIQLCQGACLFLEDELWSQACDNSFAYNLGVLAASFFRITGQVLIEVKGQDIRGREISSVPVIQRCFLDGPLPDWYFEASS
jgi:uncharacterized protein